MTPETRKIVIRMLDKATGHYLSPDMAGAASLLCPLSLPR